LKSTLSNAEIVAPSITDFLALMTSWSRSAGWLLVIKLPSLLLFGRRHLVAVFGDILIAQRNALPGWRARYWALDAILMDAASRQGGCQVSRRGDREIDLSLGERQADLDAHAAS
jgi:hypothetical protein